jgi:AraC-like DNA-binding protein
MQMTVIAPSPRTAAFVERYTIVESDDEATRVLIPEPGLHLGVRYRGAASLVDGDRATRLGDLVVTGLRSSARTIRTHAGGGIVVALFRPAGAAAVFSTPLHELFGATAPLDALVARRDAARLGERIAEPADAARRVAIVEDFLAAQASRAARDPVVDAAIAAIAVCHGAVRIAALADQLGISQDPLEKRFRRIVGGSPKQLASILRVRRAIELGRAGASWSTVAYRAGYFDQSHFIREFRAIVGQPPTRFFRDVEHC